MGKQFEFAGAALGVVFLAASVEAQQVDHSSMHMMSHAPDTRKALDFFQPMRKHILSNMQSHLQALSEILAAPSTGDGPKARKIAETRLGLDSSEAGARMPKSATTESSTQNMAATMAKYTPEEMRALGLAMHDSAGAFAREAATAQTGADPKPAIAALTQVTQNCAACHAAYHRLK